MGFHEPKITDRCAGAFVVIILSRHAHTHHLVPLEGFSDILLETLAT
jgi:hypothetical protein